MGWGTHGGRYNGIIIQSQPTNHHSFGKDASSNTESEQKKAHDGADADDRAQIIGRNDDLIS